MYIVDTQLLKKHNNKLITTVNGNPVSLSGEDIVVITRKVTGCCGNEKITEQEITIKGATQEDLKILFELQNGHPGKVSYVPETKTTKTNKSKRKTEKTEGETE